MQLLPPTKEVCEGYVFTRVCLSTGGSAGPHPGGEVEGSGWGGSPGPHPGGSQAHTRGVSRPRPGGRGCIPACTEADPPKQTATAAGGNAFLF